MHADLESARRKWTSLANLIAGDWPPPSAWGGSPDRSASLENVKCSRPATERTGMPKSACIGTRRPGNVAEHVAGALVTMCGASPERPTMTAFIRGATRARRHGDLRHGSGQFRGERSFSAARPARLRIRRGLRSMTRSPAAWVSRDDMPYACAGLCGSVLHSGRSILLIDLI